MKITALQLIADAERTNSKNFNSALSHLMLIIQSFDAGIATSPDPNLQEAFKGTFESAKRFLASNPTWQKAEIEIIPDK
jgi:hypothetical protein